ncbi:sigma-54 dependent transcriptional regulator [Pseudomonas sp. BMS12]|uniref:sigma-54 dependent transcriptional regulator n=1 Tax=Pseudomonas sp. BMS12 TaxID=1796033 RepID=UPI00083A8A03|nr:sigma-54 dependent transcriptional regulator [Pseudomonas sp. BMS12]
MSQVLAAAPRRLLVVDPCQECELLLPRLQASGWAVQSCGLAEANHANCDVGLIRLHLQHLTRPESLKELISQSGTEWIAVLNAEALMQPDIGNFVGEWFFDYHTLPFDLDRVGIALGRAFGMARLRGNINPSGGDSQGHELLGSSRSICDLRRLLAKLAPTDAPVLIRGESGTGKELVAHTLHQLSRRTEGAFVVVNCGAIPEHLIQSELFGHEKGSFTGAHQRKLGRIELADGGTLFLDEIGDLPLELQANLLRFLQEMQIERVGSHRPFSVNVRVLAATHIDLEEAVRRGRFREDLYYRLNVLQVQTTPLRERVADIGCLAEYFAQRYAVEIGRRPRNFSEDARQAMFEHTWPGNVRELANRVRRGMVLAEGKQIEAVDLGLAKELPSLLQARTLDDYICRAEQQALRDVLARHSGNMTRAAQTLGVSRPTLYRLLHKHQLF